MKAVSSSTRIFVNCTSALGRNSSAVSVRSDNTEQKFSEEISPETLADDFRRLKLIRFIRLDDAVIAGKKQRARMAEILAEASRLSSCAAANSTDIRSDLPTWCAAPATRPLPQPHLNYLQV